MGKKILAIGLLTLFIAVMFGVQIAELVVKYLNLEQYEIMQETIPFFGKLIYIVKSAIASGLTMLGFMLIKMGILPKR